MIKTVAITNHRGERIEMDIFNPSSTGFLIASITGLGPVNGTINMSEISTGDGSIYNSSRISYRNIVLALVYRPRANETIEDIRHKTYYFFPVKKRLKIEITTDTRTVEIYGYVETNELNIFTKMESSQISIICPDPYFYSSGENGIMITTFSGIESTFEFPYSNESLSEDLTEFGKIMISSRKTITYYGDIDIGLTFKIHMLGNVENLIIYDIDDNEYFALNTDILGFPFQTNDDIEIVTIVGQKRATLIRNGMSYNILNCVDRGSSWLQLHTGDNIFAYEAEVGSENVRFVIENRIAYEGI